MGTMRSAGLFGPVGGTLPNRQKTVKFQPLGEETVVTPYGASLLGPRMIIASESANSATGLQVGLKNQTRQMVQTRS